MQPPRKPRLRRAAGPEDAARIVERHETLYAREQGFDPNFARYVGRPLDELLARAREDERVWIADDAEGFAGCVAVVRREAREAQLRWFLVEPRARRRGLGTTLLGEALRFARAQGYARMILWTVDGLHAAERLYLRHGFVRVEDQAAHLWGRDVVEACYALDLLPSSS